jgi:hypothetical protein
MESGWVERIRWRRRGAWLWPAFVALIIVDAAVAHAWPATEDNESYAAGVVVALVLNLVAVLLLSRPLGALFRRARPDMPVVVARNYGGTAAVLLVSAGILTAGLVHHATVVANENAMRDATVRAQAWIGARAPDEFRRNVRVADTFTIEPGSIYRTCVPGSSPDRNYCVIVRTRVPFAQSVTFAGHEPNELFAQGVG